MYHTTGLSREQIVDVCVLVHSDSVRTPGHVCPPILGLFNSVVVTLAYLRRNRVQAELAEAFGVSQPTISRAISTLTPILGRLLADHVPVAEDLDMRSQYIIDGTLLPCWSWTGHPELYSGKHHTTGMNVQVACDLSGRLAWVSDPVDGRRHDIAALPISGVLQADHPDPWLGDKGYIGAEMITPIRKPPYRDMLDWEKKLNTAVNQIRYKIEQTISHLKTWRILHTDYRLPATTRHVHRNNLGRPWTRILPDLP